MITRKLGDSVVTASATTFAALLLACSTSPLDDPADGADSGTTNGAVATDDESAGEDNPPNTSDNDTTTGDDSGETKGGGDDPTATDGEDETGTTTGTTGEPGPDLRLVGPFTVESETGAASLSSGCSMNYSSFAPAGVDDAPAVVLAHGFMGNRAAMAGWAEHWASWGVRVVTPDLCHATILDADHPQNGEDLRLLAVDLALGPVIYAGYSAGGLAAVIAGSADSNTVAVVGLDMVDSDGQGAAAAPSIDSAAFMIMGEPAACNESNNGIPVFAAAGGQSLRVTNADHCDFMSPADGLCGFTCMGSDGGPFDDATIASAVRGLSTAAVVWTAGIEPTGVQWWTPGAPYYDELVDIGIVQLP